jgi:hypothetical protein
MDIPVRITPVAGRLWRTAQDLEKLDRELIVAHGHQAITASTRSLVHDHGNKSKITYTGG